MVRVYQDPTPIILQAGREKLQDPKVGNNHGSLRLLPVPQHPRSQQEVFGVSKTATDSSRLVPSEVNSFLSRTVTGWGTVALQLPLKGAKPRGPQPTPDQARQEQCDLWGGCSTPPGTGKTREEPASPAKASCEARAHAATPTARWLARSLAPRVSPRPRGLRAHRAARTPDESPRPPSSTPSRLARPGQASHLQAPQEEQDASSRRRAANGSDLFIAFRDSAAAAGEGRRGGGAARVKGRAATSPEAGLGKCAQEGGSRQPGDT